MVARTILHQRSNKSWEPSYLPTKSILKNSRRGPQLTKPILKSKNKLVIEKTELNLEEMMDKLQIIVHSQPINTTISKLYQIFDFEDIYESNTRLLVKHSITKERIVRIQKNDSIITFSDVFDIQDLLETIIDEGEHLSNQIHANFYCDSYWLIKYTDVIVIQVFDTFNIEKDTSISFDPNKRHFQSSPDSRLEQTHIIKDHLSYCDWIASTIAPNYKNNNVPDNINILFLRMLKHLHTLLTTSSNDCVSWLDYACGLF